jgi:hypothetical protein
MTDGELNDEIDDAGAISQRFTGQVAWSLDDVGHIAAAFGCTPAELVAEPTRRPWLGR